MQAVAAIPDVKIRWGAVVSLALHGGVILFLILLLPPVEPPQSPPEESISVEMVPSPELSVVPSPETPAAPPQVPADVAPQPEKQGELASVPPSVAVPSQPPVQVPAAPPAPKTDGLIAAKQLFSDKILANARSKPAREALRQLSGEERILQLCDLEALEQVSRFLPGSSPDLVAPYAMMPEQSTVDGVEVKGGAFRAKKKWYNIQFKCAVDAHSGKVASFAFAIGDAIPESEWQAHDLVADDGPAD